MEAILAGMFISLGAIVYLKVGGVVGAVLFSVGLMSVLYTEAHLFTGKARLLVSKEIAPEELFKIWCGNVIGVCAIAYLMAATPLGVIIAEPAAAIVGVRIANGFLTNVIMGIGCGILMTSAVEGTTTTENWLFAIIPVAVFILIGFNHCVADMFYIAICGGLGIETLIPTTIGNIIGCCVSPMLKKLVLTTDKPLEKEPEETRKIGFSSPPNIKLKEEKQEQKPQEKLK